MAVTKSSLTILQIFQFDEINKPSFVPMLLYLLLFVELLPYLNEGQFQLTDLLILGDQEMGMAENRENIYVIQSDN